VTTDAVLGSNAGSYTVTAAVGSLTSSEGYQFNYVNNTLTVNPATLTVTAEAKTKTYADVDPSLTYTYGSLKNGDTSSVFSGSLSRASGENVNTYAISQGSVSAGSNYTISYTGANLTISPATLTVTAEAKTKTYADVDPSLTYTYGSLKNGDTSAVFSGSLSRASGENVNTYAISQGSVSAGSNYTISYTGANLTISPATLTVTAEAKTKSQRRVSASNNYTISYTGANLNINQVKVTNIIMPETSSGLIATNISDINNIFNTKSYMIESNVSDFPSKIFGAQTFVVGKYVNAFEKISRVENYGTDNKLTSDDKKNFTSSKLEAAD